MGRSGLWRVSRSGVAPACRGPEKASDRVEQLRLMRQEGIVTAFGLELNEAHFGGDRVQRMHHLAAFLAGKQPIARERDEAKPRARALKGIGEHTPMVRG